MKYLISGGGTGGHIYPALAIADKIKEYDDNAEILYIGTENSLESELVPKKGYKFKTVRVEGLPRKLNIDFLKSIKKLLLGLNDARKIVKDFEPDVAIGTGGYVSGPIILIASLKGVPSMIHEQNAYPGITNKILSRFVDYVAVTFTEAVSHFKNKEKVVVTGNPVRKEIIDSNIRKEKSIYKKYNLNDNKPLVLSFGGSGGQYRLNESILEILESNKIENFQLMHITGKRLEAEFNNKLKYIDEEHLKNVIILPYLYDMPEVMNISDLIITSSGAITLSEISAIGKPSVLIPKGYTAENHQEHNAKAFENKNASIVIKEEDLKGELLLSNINKILNNEDLLKEMSENSKKLGNIKATDDILEIIKKLIRGR